MSDTVWILTYEINEYYQDGEYFLAVFFFKPSFEELKSIMQESDETVQKTLDGYGRIGKENTWYNLKEVKIGVRYE